MTRIDPTTTALLVIDMQRDFLSPGGYGASAGLEVATLRAPIPNIAALLDGARGAGLFVVHTREGHRADLTDCHPQKLARSRNAGAQIGSEGPLGRLLVRGEYGHDIVDELAPAAGEPVIDKAGYGAFYQTDLELILHTRKIDTLLITGITTEVCVQSTLREAVDRGFRCITVENACASAYPELHHAAMQMIGVEGGILGEVRSTEEVLGQLAPGENMP